MSYILDALKKSEAERSRGAVPTLLTPPQTQFRSSVIGWVLVAVLIVNAGLLAGWLYWPEDKSDTPVRAPEAAPQVATPVPASPPTQPTARASDTPTSSSDAAPQPHESPVARADPTPLPEIPREPSASTSGDAATADISFSTHVYATDPSMRAVTMEGKRFVEGDAIRSGVLIKEITETGVVLEVNGRLIPVDVLQDWR